MALGWRGQYYRYREFSLNLLTIYKQRQDIQAFLEIILSLTTLIIFTIFALKPTALTMITLNKDIQEKQTTLNGLNQKINDLQTANSVFTQDQNVVPDIDASVFTIPKPDTVSKQVLGVALKDSVTIIGTSIGQLTILGPGITARDSSDVRPLPPGAQAMSISISAKGSYSDLVTFLKDLENLRIPIKIDTVTVNSSQTESGTTIVELITGRVPYLGQQ